MGPHTCWVGQVRLPCVWQGRITQLVRDHRQRPWVARDAGRVWAADCDAFLLGEGFVQSIVDRSVFIKQLGAFTCDKIFVIGVYVDDYWTYCEDDVAWDDFYGKWSSRYTASAIVNEAGSDF